MGFRLAAPRKASYCEMHHLYTTPDHKNFTSKLSMFIPDVPPTKGYNPPNINSLQWWRNEREYKSPWVGQTRQPRNVLTQLYIDHVGRATVDCS